MRINITIEIEAKRKLSGIKQKIKLFKVHYVCWNQSDYYLRNVNFDMENKYYVHCDV